MAIRSINNVSLNFYIFIVGEYSPGFFINKLVVSMFCEIGFEFDCQMLNFLW